MKVLSGCAATTRTSANWSCLYRNRWQGCGEAYLHGMLPHRVVRRQLTFEVLIDACPEFVAHVIALGAARRNDPAGRRVAARKKPLPGKTYLTGASSMSSGRLERPTHGLKVRCSTD